MEELLKILNDAEVSGNIEIDYEQVHKFIDFYDSLKKSIDNQGGVLSRPEFDFDGADIQAKLWLFDILECDSKFTALLHYCSKFEAEVLSDGRILLRFLIPGLFKARCIDG